METKKDTPNNHGEEQVGTDRYLEVLEACNARVLGIHSRYQENRAELYHARNEAILASKWNPFKILEAHRRAVAAMLELGNKAKKELQEEENRKRELALQFPGIWSKQE